MIKKKLLHLLHLADITVSHTNLNSSDLIITWKPQKRVGSCVILVIILGTTDNYFKTRQDKKEIMLRNDVPTVSPRMISAASQFFYFPVPRLLISA